MTRGRKSKNWLEWTVFAASLLLVTGILGYLIYHALSTPSGPPVVDVELGSPRRQSGHYAIPVTVTNRGHETAERVHIQVTLEKAHGPPEESSFQIQFLPPGAIQHGTVTFDTDPEEAKQITSRVLGYQRP
jgi:uncharacterized protein (TIGR02588 family)